MLHNTENKLSVPYAGDLVWRQSRAHWTAYRADATRFTAKPLKQPPQWDMETFARQLLGLGGKRVSVHYSEEPAFCQRLLRAGKVISTDQFRVEQGTLNECHHNSCGMRKTNTDLKLIRGYALFSHAWNDHTWLLDNTGTLIETTARASIYYGIILGHTEAEAFTRSVLPT